MRKLRNLCGLLFTASVLSLTSCSSNDDGGDAGPAGSGTVVAKVDGTTFKSLKIASTANFTAGGGGVLTLQGSDADGKAIIMIINGYTGVGAYTITSSNVFITASYIETNINNPSASKTYMAPFESSGETGEIKVAEDTDGNVTGTFGFTAKSTTDGTTKTISEGSFNLTKQSN